MMGMCVQHQAQDARALRVSVCVCVCVCVWGGGLLDQRAQEGKTPRFHSLQKL